jgi:hypothetical protein
MNEKNRVSMELSGRAVDIRIIASSEAMAAKFYESIEVLIVQMVRIDLESEWNRRCH